MRRRRSVIRLPMRFTFAVLILYSCIYACFCSNCTFTARNVNTFEDVVRQLLESSCIEGELFVDGVINVGSAVNIERKPTQFLTKLVIRGTEGSEISCSSNFSETTGFVIISNISVLSVENVTFSNCPGAVFLSEIQSVSLRHSHFRNFSRFGCVTIYNSEDVILSSVTFTDCHSNDTTVRFASNFVGHSGGLTIVSTKSGFSTNNIISLSDVLFDNCSSITTGGDVSGTNAFLQSELIGLGGGLGTFFFPHGSNSYSVTIKNTHFTNCSASLLGGGMIVFNNRELELEVVLDGTSFTDNSAILHNGGGLSLVTVTPTDVGDIFSIVVTNSSFTKNEAPHGGGVYLVANSNTTQVTFDRVRFESNSGGGILAVPSNISVLSPRPLIVIRDCTFQGTPTTTTFSFAIDNAVLVVVQSLVAFEGSVKFLNNLRACLYPVQSKVLVKGNVEFSSNEQVWIIPDSSQVVMYRGSRLLFKGNSAFYGTGFYVRDVALLAGAIRLFGRTISNPLCFLQFEDPTVPPTKWDNVTIEFIDNSSQLGTVALISTFSFCSWTGRSGSFFEPEKVLLDWSGVTLINNTNKFYGNNLDQRLSVQSLIYNYFANITIPDNLFPGDKVEVSSQCHDELGTDTVCILDMKSVLNSRHHSNVPLDLGERVFISGVNGTVQSLSLTIPQKDGLLPGDIDVRVLPITTALGITTMSEKSTTANATLGPCPLGFLLHEVNGRYSCRCDDELPDSQVVKCIEDNEKLIIARGKWASYSVGEDGTPFLETHLCPHTYCSCGARGEASSFNQRIKFCLTVFDPENPDEVCSCYRTGFLCGRCTQGGVSALLGRCLLCDAASGAWIFGLVIVDVVLIVLAIYFLRPPADLFYPVLFYLQTVPYLIVNRLYPILETLYFISSALGLYFPWDACLFPGATALDTHALRFIPVILLIPVSTATVAILIRCSLWKRKKNGLWLLFLLMYNQALHTIVSLLNCPRLYDNSGQPQTVWFYDGTVKCFADPRHGLLAVFALILLMCLVGVSIILLVCLVKPKKEWRHIWGFFAQSVTPYKKDCQWFVAVELFRRTALIIHTQVDPLNTVPTFTVLFIIITLYAYCQPYKCRIASIMELVLLWFTVTFLPLLFPDAAISSIELRNNDTRLCQPNDVPDILTPANYVRLCFYLPVLALIILVLWLLGRWTVRKFYPKIKAWREARRTVAIGLTDTSEVDSDFCETSVYANTPEAVRKQRLLSRIPGRWNSRSDSTSSSDSDVVDKQGDKVKLYPLQLTLMNKQLESDSFALMTINN